MNKRGDVGWGEILAMALVVIFLLVAVSGLLGPIFKSARLAWSSSESKFDYASCAKPSLTGTCPVSNLDLDADCAPDTCDPCVLASEGKGKTGIDLEQARGSNLCDDDGDNVADACDADPHNPKVIGCASTLSDGRCNKMSEAFKTTPFACKKKLYNPSPFS